MNELHNFEAETKWVTFGGSYSGELAAWARLKYPNLFYAALASSAPVTAQVDYDKYDGIVARALATPLVGGSAGCRDAVRAAFVTLESHFDTKRAGLKVGVGTLHTLGNDARCAREHWWRLEAPNQQPRETASTIMLC